MEYHKKDGKKIPILSIVDNGCGMRHSDIERMLSFGHKRHTRENKEFIGRFGVGLKVSFFLLFLLNAIDKLIFRLTAMFFSLFEVVFIVFFEISLYWSCL